MKLFTNESDDGVSNLDGMRMLLHGMLMLLHGMRMLFTNECDTAVSICIVCGHCCMVCECCFKPRTVSIMYIERICVRIQLNIIVTWHFINYAAKLLLFELSYQL